MTEKCKKGFKRIAGVCVNGRIKKSFDKNGIPQKLLALTLTTVFLGFGWLAIRGFADMPVFSQTSPMWRFIIGVIGVGVVSWISWAVFGIKVRK